MAPTIPTLTVEQVEEALGPLDRYAHDCHSASLALVRSGLLGPDARVARGLLRGVLGQHSWAVVGDPYDLDAPRVDITAWSYDLRVPRVWVTDGPKVSTHRPHGHGHIAAWGVPECGNGEDVPLAVEVGRDATRFLALVARNNNRSGLDARGWMSLLSHAPVDGWPAAEITAAADDTPRLKAFVPIDRLGMLTDRNPGGLYR